jgi:hypothetical protein
VRVICDRCGFIYGVRPERQVGEIDAACSNKPRGTLRELTDDELRRTVGGFGYIAAYRSPFRFAQGSLL